MANIAALLQLKGPVSFSGEASVGFGYELISQLRTLAPDISVSARQPDVISLAMATKTKPRWSRSAARRRAPWTR